MTFGEALKKLNKEEVQKWWDKSAPQSATEKAISENWKYFLYRNGKRLPFKWSLELIFDHFLGEKIRINSDYETRDKVASELGIEIQEDLVCDQTHIQNFKTFISTKVKQLDSFKDFIEFAHKVVIQNNIEPYNIRAALPADNAAMLVIGMRAVLAYIENNQQAELRFILNDSFAKEKAITTPLKYLESFKGEGEKCWCSYPYKQISEIEPSILENFEQSLLEEYEKIKGTKRSQWNVEAKTTNDALKAAIFENLDINKIEPMLNKENQLFSLYERFLKGEGFAVTTVPAYLESAKVQMTKSWKNKYQEDINHIELSKGTLEAILVVSNQYYQGDFQGKNSFQRFIKKMIEDKNPIKNMTKSTLPLNQTLYGPPGTGKTYSTVLKALSIIEEKSEEALKLEDREDLKKRFDNLLEHKQIVFTTFHQSMSYEDFIEGIKPEKPNDDNGSLTYAVQNGVFKKLADNAKFEIIKKYDSQTDKERISFSNAFDQLADQLSRKLEEGEKATLKSKSGSDFLFDGLSSQGNILVKHFGEGENYTVSKTRLSRLNDGIENLDAVNNIHNEFRAIIGGSNSSVYWAVLNAVRNIMHNPNANELKKEVSISEEDKIDLIEKHPLEYYKGKTAKPFILIIDEINRGNVASIFGELITLIEKDKRAGEEEALEVTLPYSKQKFSVPNNLYIIGTMNTADRSVEALDSALRRRFSFEEMMPKPELLSPENMILRLWNHPKYFEVKWDNPEFRDRANKLYEFLGVNISFEEKHHKNTDPRKWELDDLKKNSPTFSGKGISLKDVLETINNRIEVLIDRDHTIGHSYFMGLECEENIEEATKAVFKDKVIPLLQEYFFNDYGKIQLVLGEGFVSKKTDSKTLFHKPNNNDIEIEDYLQKPNYNFEIDADGFDIKDALMILLEGKQKEKALTEKQIEDAR